MVENTQQIFGWMNPLIIGMETFEIWEHPVFSQNFRYETM